MPKIMTCRGIVWYWWSKRIVGKNRIS